MIFLQPFIDKSQSILFNCNKDSVAMVTAAIDITSYIIQQRRAVCTFLERIQLSEGQQLVSFRINIQLSSYLWFKPFFCGHILFSVLTFFYSCVFQITDLSFFLSLSLFPSVRLPSLLPILVLNWM
jgi:hypothetical protein